MDPATVERGTSKGPGAKLLGYEDKAVDPPVGEGVLLLWFLCA